MRSTPARASKPPPGRIGRAKPALERWLIRHAPGVDGAAPAAGVHPTALVEEGVVLGPGTAVWDGAHLRRGARLGRECIVGEKTYIAYDVVVGDRVKINAAVYVCAGVTIEDGCMISAHVVFTNDRYPRATDPELRGLATSAPTADTLPTVVRRGVTIGANATIGPGLEIGEFAMIGMGAVVTRDVRPYTLVRGAPARFAGFVCRCGHPLKADGPARRRGWQCARCGRRYRITANAVAVA